MRLDLIKLRQNVLNYIQHPSSQEDLAEEQNSVLFNFIATLCFIPLGLVLICTIFLAPLGWSMAYAGFMSIVTGAVFEDPVKSLRKEAEKLHIFVASPVIVGPQGFGLLLFSESENSASRPGYLAKKAELLRGYYSGNVVAMTPQDQALIDLLQEDHYEPDRRRLVPASHADGQRLVLLDTEIKLKHVVTDNSGKQMVLCAFQPNSVPEIGEQIRGHVIPLPWQLTKPAQI